MNPIVYKVVVLKRNKPVKTLIVRRYNAGYSPDYMLSKGLEFLAHRPAAKAKKLNKTL